MSNQDAKDQAMSEAESKVMSLLEYISDRVHDLPAPESDALQWKHVDKMRDVAKSLESVLEFVL